MSGLLLLVTCKQTYIGQTKQNLKTSSEEHDPPTFGKSDVTDHLKENPDHTIDFCYPLTLAQQLTGENYTLRTRFIFKSCSHN